MTQQEHAARHAELHRLVDELVADYLACTGGSITDSIEDLMAWSSRQQEAPEEPYGEKYRRRLNHPRI